MPRLFSNIRIKDHFLPHIDSHCSNYTHYYLVSCAFVCILMTTYMQLNNGDHDCCQQLYLYYNYTNIHNYQLIVNDYLLRPTCTMVAIATIHDLLCNAEEVRPNNQCTQPHPVSHTNLQWRVASQLTRHIPYLAML